MSHSDTTGAAGSSHAPSHSSRSTRPAIMAAEHAIAAGHYLATEAGLAVLNGGGNAVDAGVAAGLAMGVVQSDLVNVAGVAPIMIWSAETAEIVSIDGLGTWPSAIPGDLFQHEHGGSVPLGVLRTVVPAAPAAWLTALERYGTLAFAEVAAGAIRLASDGFAIDPFMCEVIEEHEEDYARWPENRAVYLPNGRPPRPGERFVQPDLAATLQYMVDEEAAAGGGREAGIAAAYGAFYRGDIARAIAEHQREHGGYLGMSDLAEYRVRFEPTAVGRFAGLEVHCCGPWSQGASLAQLLNMLDGMDLAALGHNTTAYLHSLVEAIKLVFADRERYFGDPAFVDVPVEGLLSDAYAAARRELIRADRAWPEMPPAGDPLTPAALEERSARDAPRRPAPATTSPSHDTSYVCVVDRDGNAFSATPSDVSYQAPVVPGTGLVPSTRGSQSRGDPSHPSSMAPGKRPRLTPNPAIALENGRPALVFGTPGGDVQIQAMAQFLVNAVVVGMDVQQAIEAPRVASYSYPSSFAPNDDHPGLLMAEERIPADTRGALAALGHRVEPWPAFTRKAGAVSAIRIDSESGILHAGADPRRAGYAIGR